MPRDDKKSRGAFLSGKIGFSYLNKDNSLKRLRRQNNASDEVLTKIDQDLSPLKIGSLSKNR